MEKEEGKSKGKKKYIISIIFLIALIVITFFVIFLKYDIKELVRVIQTVEAKWLFLAIGMILIYIFFEGLAMRHIFKSMNVDVSITNNFMYSAIDYYFCAVTPSASGGQPMVAYYMAKDDISLSQVSLTLIINTALFKIVLIILSIISVIFCSSLLFQFPIMITLFIVGIIINVVLIALCFLMTFKRSWIQKVGLRLIFWGYHHKLVKKPYDWARRFVHKMDEYERGAILIHRNRLKFVLALLCNLIQRVAFFSIGYFVFLAFKDSYAIADFGYIELFAIQVSVALCVDSLPLPGGVGISEYLYVLLFGLVYNVGQTNVVGSAMLLTRAVNFYIPLIFTFIIVLIKHSLTMRHKTKE